MNGPHRDQSCALGVTGTMLWPSEPISGQELRSEPRVLLLHSNFHEPKATLEAQELGTTTPHCGSAFWPYFEHQKKIPVAPHVNMKSCPTKPFIHTQVSPGRRPRNAGRVKLEERFLTGIRYQNKEPIPWQVNVAWHGSMCSFPEVSRTSLWHNIQM